MKRLPMMMALALTVALPLSGVAAQTQSRVAYEKDWSIFTAGEGADKVCWIASKPTQSRAMRGGEPVEVRRGDIYLMVRHKPADGTENEVSFIAGYPFKKGSKVEAEIGSDKFDMFTMDENAWMASKDKDNEIVAAFRRGAKAELQGVSSRGTTTVDEFSLSGFTAAIDEAKKRCK